MRTPICDTFGIEFPIFAFSHCRDVVAAVSKAGGLGVLGAVAFSPEQLEIELNWIDEHIDGKPYGVDVVMPASYVGSDLSELEKMIPEQHINFAEERYYLVLTGRYTRRIIEPRVALANGRIEGDDSRRVRHIIFPVVESYRDTNATGWHIE